MIQEPDKDCTVFRKQWEVQLEMTMESQGKMGKTPKIISAYYLMYRRKKIHFSLQQWLHQQLHTSPRRAPDGSSFQMYLITEVSFSFCITTPIIFPSLTSCYSLWVFCLPCFSNTSNMILPQNLSVSSSLCLQEGEFHNSSSRHSHITSCQIRLWFNYLKLQLSLFTQNPCILYPAL